MAMNFFADALRQAMLQKHFNQAQLAEFLKVDPAYVSRWLKGSSPRLDQMRSVLALLGWDLERARPEYDPFNDAIRILEESREGSDAKKGKKAPATTPLGDVREVKQLLQDAAESHRRQQQRPVHGVGKLNAEKGIMQQTEPTELNGLQAISDMLRPVDYADNDILVIHVHGHHLAPVYPDGSLLLTRRILKPHVVPDGTDVFFEAIRKPGSFHLRRLVRISEGRSGRIDRVIGAPLCASHNYLFYRPREVRLHAAVVGALSITRGKH
jgi:transcriptional regulator with XRE-family HTH domain